MCGMIDVGIKANLFRSDYMLRASPAQIIHIYLISIRRTMIIWPSKLINIFKYDIEFEMVWPMFQCHPLNHKLLNRVIITYNLVFNVQLNVPANSLVQLTVQQLYIYIYMSHICVAKNNFHRRSDLHVFCKSLVCRNHL